MSQKYSSYYKEYCVSHVRKFSPLKNDFPFCFVTRNIFPVTQGVLPVRGFDPPLAMGIHHKNYFSCERE